MKRPRHPNERPLAGKLGIMQLTDFSKGMRVRYVPGHAHNDIQHEDCEDGVVSSRSRIDADVVFVKYDNTFEPYMKTGDEPYTAVATSPQDLVPLEPIWKTGDEFWTTALSSQATGAYLAGKIIETEVAGVTVKLFDPADAQPHIAVIGYEDLRPLSTLAPEPEPLPIVIHCPNCGLQHVDEPEPHTGWTNPPHKSHLCHGCGTKFRTADVPTTGVLKTSTRGAADTWPSAAPNSMETATTDGQSTEDHLSTYLRLRGIPAPQIISILSFVKQIKRESRGTEPPMSEKLSVALDLLERASSRVDSTTAPDAQWFKDYFLLTGEHMVLTADGWIHGKDAESLPAEERFDEVNSPIQLEVQTA